MQNLKLVNLLLRISIASVFLYASVAAFLQPEIWIYYFPQFLRDIIPHAFLLNGFAIYQIILSIWILSGWRAFHGSALASLTFLAIIAANFTYLDVLFRDFAIFFASLALLVGSSKKFK
jgi:hypothetical protein